MHNNEGKSRRELMKMMAMGSSVGLFGLLGGNKLMAEEKETPSYARGMAPVTITKIKAIATCPEGINLIVVKVETSEPGLYGLGCATFNQRAAVVVTAINSYLNEFAVGKNVDNIEDMWNSFYVSSYWRNGPVLNYVIRGVAEALWDNKG